ncbi:MAG: GNAT family N-acetyltransferase [Oscillospiraceae bacterium]|nr:GNAT family N-acetyltransferase [Oscillospiraceae bacterium]
MIDHKGTQTLKTERLILRRFNVEDAENMYNNWANDERVTKFLSWAPHSSPELTKTLIAEWCTHYAEENYYHWIIEMDGNVVGSIGVVLIDEKNEWAEIGYTIGYNYWRKGITAEAATAVRDFLFGEVGFNRLVIRRAEGNHASGRVAEKSGFLQEGVERGAFKSKGGEFWDMVQYSMLKKEWLNIDK